ncbi:MAG: exo-alpha-sialidase [Acidobacteria bacterium]|nr:exo-alpha-sialidase [Acidobacteriota bacterium]
MNLSPFKRRLPATLAALTATTVLAACGGDDPTLADGSEESASLQEGSALEHIHGLGINPADGQLFIATHNGLFTAPEGDTTPSKVGETTQDIMGFSVIGPNRFIGSGHPALDQNLPPHLGLIESRDGGNTWKHISLLGDADFHVLEAAGNQVYGFDGTQGRLMVSSDGGRNWQQRIPPAGVFGLAIDPNNSSRVVASTEQGLFVSKNNGRDWRPLQQDLTGLLTWPNRERLYVVDAHGQVQVSSNGGANWQTRGDIGGQPAAFIAHENELYAALVDGTVKRSTDGGATWTVRTTAS